MFVRKYGTLSLVALGCLLMVLLSACGGQIAPNAASQSLLLSNASQNTSLASITTACPAAGTGRAAVLPPLKLGTHQNLLYTSNQFDNRDMPLKASLKRYDVTTKSATTILAVKGKPIHDAQISADGQWVLFETQANQNTKLELIRVDGRYQQTLYCSKSAGIFQMQWSTDQKLIVFQESNGTTELVNVLDTTNGIVQADLSISLASPSNAVNIHTWLDTTRVYLTNTQIDQPANIIYLLDTSKGPGQHVSNLPVVFKGNFTDFDSSYDGTKLVINSCTCGLGGNTGPSTITVQPATGGKSQTLFYIAKYAITSVRAVTPTTLLFTIYNYAALGGQSDQSQNGLWKINTDGTGLMRLTTDAKGAGSSFNQFSQFPWSNVSRDGNLYAIQVTANALQALNVGPLSGGASTTVASFNGTGTTLNVVGWTTF